MNQGFLPAPRSRLRLLVAFAVAVSSFVLACSGGPKPSAKPPLEPSSDTPPSSDDPMAVHDEDSGISPWSATEDAGAPSAGGAASVPTAPPGAAVLKGDDEGAQAFLKQFVAPNADHATLTRSMKPSTADYKTLFDSATASKIEAAQAKDWDKAVIKPTKPSQTEIKVWSATGAEIAAGKGNAKEFPGGYKKVAKHLAPAMTFFRFKFVEPGKDAGTAYDGLAFVNGHWVIAPKPWLALDAKGDADEPKPKTKKKKKK